MQPGGNVLSDRDMIVADLERCDVLAAAARADLESLAGLLVPFTAPAETVLLRRGDVAGHFLLLISGPARVAIAIAARRSGISRFCADVLADNAPMRAILDHAGIKWQPAEAGIGHGHAAVPDPGKFGITPGMVAALAAVVDELKLQL
jgi:hypothetical protein